MGMESLISGLGKEALATAVAVIAAAAAGLVLHGVLFAVVSRLSRRTDIAVDDALVARSRRPARLLFALVPVLVITPALSLPPEPLALSRHVVSLALIAAVGWLAVSLTRVIEDTVDAKYPLDVENNLHARQLHTQVRLLRRIAGVFLVFVTLAFMLMTFPGIRQLGASLLASAGVAGLVVGMAARPTLSNLVAGVQLAMTQPIRLDDVVIVEGEWGRIEEIRTTFVVVRIWDSRRLIVPLSYFIENPVENWTRTTADLLGVVYVYADYTVPVDEVRAELRDVLERSGLWDGKSWGLQVTGATDRALELRAVMSAPDSSTAWNLRCYVREALVRYLRESQPESLPRLRAALDSSGDRPAFRHELSRSPH